MYHVTLEHLQEELNWLLVNDSSCSRCLVTSDLFISNIPAVCIMLRPFTQGITKLHQGLTLNHPYKFL